MEPFGSLFDALPMSADIVASSVRVTNGKQTPLMATKIPMREGRVEQHPMPGQAKSRDAAHKTFVRIASKPIEDASNAIDRNQTNQCEETKHKQIRPNLALAKAQKPALSVIAPITGAAHTNSFDRGQQSEAAEISHYMTQTLFTHLFEGHKERHAWFVVFQVYPILFHAFAHAAAVHKDALRRNVAISATPQSLHHKGQAMTLLNEALGRLDVANVEVLLIVMVTLATHDLSTERLSQGGEMGFIPHEPDAYWMNVYGRLDTIEQHLGAIGGLVGMVGGLQKITLPGLANCLALTDMMVAGTNSTRPSFPCNWTPDPEILASHSKSLSSTNQRPGKGFFANIPGGLPPHALSVLLRLATIDRYMAKYCGTDMPEDAYRGMMNTRNSLHHSILCLANWDDLSHTERALAKTCKPPLYEAARLAALLYSCAVIYGLPPHRNWHTKLAYKLRKVIEGHPKFMNEAPGLLLWVLCVGALATLRSPDRTFFEKALRALVSKYEERLASLEKVMGVLEDFVWSSRACEDGLREFWEGL